MVDVGEYTSCMDPIGCTYNNLWVTRPSHHFTFWIFPLLERGFSTREPKTEEQKQQWPDTLVN